MFQKLVTSIFAENDVLKALRTVYSCAHDVKISYSKTNQNMFKSDLKSRIPPMYDILRDKKFKKFKSPCLTIHPENITMILNMQKDHFQSKQ